MNDASKAMEPSADRLIEMAEHHGMDYSRHGAMMDFARAVWRMGRDSALSASSGTSDPELPAMKATADCRHTRQKWNIQGTHGYCVDCGAQFPKPAEAVRQPLTDLWPLIEAYALAVEDKNGITRYINSVEDDDWTKGRIKLANANLEKARDAIARAIEAGITGAQE